MSTATSTARQPVARLSHPRGAGHVLKAGSIALPTA
jgi:hypothetical protein